jgi:hypothetical protein
VLLVGPSNCTFQEQNFILFFIVLLVGPSHCAFQEQNFMLCFIVLLVGPSRYTFQEQNSQIRAILNPTPMHQLAILSMGWGAFFSSSFTSVNFFGFLIYEFVFNPDLHATFAPHYPTNLATLLSYILALPTK